MVSAIDPSKPVDGQVAVKADLRANLLAARNEILALQAAGGGAVAIEKDGTQILAAATRFNFTGGGVGSVVDAGGGEGTITIPGTVGGNFTHPATGALAASVGDTLGGFEANVVTAFGAYNDGTNAATNTTRLQAAIDSGWPLYFPPGTYAISDSLVYDQNQTVVMRGSHGKGADNTKFAKITGNFGKPLLHREEGWVTWDQQLAGTAVATQPEIDNVGAGKSIILEDLVFVNQHIQGCCVQLWANSSPLNIRRCNFQFNYRGLLILSGFDSVVENCNFEGSWLTNHSPTVDEVAMGNAIALNLPGHNTTMGCAFVGCGTGILTTGVESNIIGCRFEINGMALKIGGLSFSPLDIFNGGANLYKAASRFLISGLSFETNYRGVLVDNSDGAGSIENFALQGGTNGAWTGGKPDYGIRVVDGEGTTLRNCGAGGYFTRSAVLIEGRAGLYEGIGGGNTETGKGTFAGTSSIFTHNSTKGLHHQVRSTAFNPGINGALASDRKTITAFHDLHLRGLKGLDILNPNVLPNNLGGIETPTTGVSTHAVAFAAAVGGGNTAFNVAPVAQANAGSTLATVPTTFYYAITSIGKRSETGIDYADAASVTYRTVTIGAGQQAFMSFFGVSDYPHRLYRGTALGRFDGYWQLVPWEFTDAGTTAFTGYDVPPGAGHTITNQNEVDTSYAIVATPSWPCSVRVTSKATTGFTLDFYQPAVGGGWAASPVPAGGTVQWLLFRP